MRTILLHRLLFLVTDLFVIAGPLYDLSSRGRVHPAYLWGGLLILSSQPGRRAVAQPQAWLAADASF